MNQRYFSLHSAQSAFILLTLTLTVWMVALPLFQDGMFLDGVQYAAVSRNLARGIGSFWYPVLAKHSVAGLDTFHEHPPLVFFLESQFFNWLGIDSIYPERIYCLLMFAINSVMIILIWRELFKEHAETRKLFWLPVLLWLCIPTVSWAYINNVQENTMTVFTSLAVYQFLKFSSASSRQYGRLVVGALSVFVAFLCKGVPGLFPLFFFVLIYFAFKPFSLSNAARNTFLIVAIVAIAFGLTLAYAPARDALHIWFFDRMLKRISSDPVSKSHFAILLNLLLDLLPAAGAASLLAISGGRIKVAQLSYSKWFLFFLMLGLSASLPLMLTLVQRTFYLTPAYPFFAIAFAALVSQPTLYLLKRIDAHSSIKAAALLLLLLSIVIGIATTVLKAGEIKRDKQLLLDIYTLRKLLPQDAFICVPSELYWNWQLRLYLIRYDGVTLNEGDSCQFKLTEKSAAVNAPYVKSADLETFSLYKQP